MPSDLVVLPLAAGGVRFGGRAEGGQVRVAGAGAGPAELVAGPGGAQAVSVG
jgi:hypothetical protein